MTSSSIPQTISGYQIISELGHGGMAIVYKALQPSLNRYIALKVLPANLAHDREFITRFRREADIARNLRHPNIVEIYEVSQQEPYYLAMQLIDGETLASILRQRQKLDPLRVAAIIHQIASALDYAHARGVIHRDVKPSNILVDRKGHAVLTDFGIARAIEATRLTKTGGMIGTPEYMSPEQGRGLPVDARGDVYSLGVVAYEMLTGQAPFHADTPLGTLHQHVYETPRSLRALNPGMPLTVEQVVLKALAKEPAQRFARVGDFANALAAAAIGKPVSITPPSQAPTRLPSSLATKRQSVPVAVALGIIGLAFCLLLASGIGIFFLRTSTPTVVIASTPTLLAARLLAETPSPRISSPTLPPTPTKILPTATAIPTPTRMPPQKQIAVDAQTVKVLDLSTRNIVTIFDTKSIIRFIASAVFSKDGKRVLVSHCYANSPSEHGHAIGIINADGTNWISIAGAGNLTTPEASCLAFGSAIWSPDEKTVAFRQGQGGAFGVFLLNPDATGMRRLQSSDISDYPLFWSTDGKWVIAISAQDSLLWALAVGGNERKPVHQVGGIEAYEERIYPWQTIVIPRCNLPDRWYEIPVGPFWGCE